MAYSQVRDGLEHLNMRIRNKPSIGRCAFERQAETLAAELVIILNSLDE